jgi:hypothetical protein
MANDLLYKASLHLGASPQNKRSSPLYKIPTVGNRKHYQVVLEQTVFNPENRCNFLVDSGASCHIYNDIRRFSHVLDSPPRKILVGNGEAILSSKVGTVELDDRIKLLNVLYVPSCGANVLSLSMLDKYNLSAHFSNGEVIIGTDSDLDVFLIGKEEQRWIVRIQRQIPYIIQKLVKDSLSQQKLRIT